MRKFILRQTKIDSAKRCGQYMAIREKNIEIFL